ncbi:hypothetical protein T484DRAFT_1763299 [Baffinella frigidus]|nr:hypothetical protein T484DRAFT_1763299 [Cryptophyta sp. CCMP2293]
MVLLATYNRFHSMLIGPAAARACCDSFANGTTLFMPSSYLNLPLPGKGDQQREGAPTKQPPAPSRLARWDASGVTVPRYFLLVVLSLTGLSTLLGLTETIDASELTPQDPVQGKASWSRLITSPDAGADPRLQVTPEATAYIAHARGAHAVRLVRRFEYVFWLVGLRVAMLHYVSLNERGEVVRRDGKDELHLVEEELTFGDPFQGSGVVRAES